MFTIGMLELRTRSKEIIDRLRRGEPGVLTYRGKFACRLDPRAGEDVECANEIPDSDPFFKLVGAIKDEESLTNEQIDEILYGPAAHNGR